MPTAPVWRRARLFCSRRRLGTARQRRADRAPVPVAVGGGERRFGRGRHHAAVVVGEAFEGQLGGQRQAGMPAVQQPCELLHRAGSDADERVLDHLM